MVRTVVGVHRWLGHSRASSLLVSVYGLKAFLGVGAPSGSGHRLLAVAVFGNARREVNRLAQWLTPETLGRVRTKLTVQRMLTAIPSLIAGLFQRRGLLRGLRFVHRLNGQYDFLVAARLASTLACYARANAILSHSRPHAILVSSNSNPEEAAFLASARVHQIPTIFISHAHANTISPPLDFTLSILEGEAAVDDHNERGLIGGDVFLAGQEGPSVPLDPERFRVERPVIGIFPPKVVSWPVFAKLVADCRERFHARELLVRWHPDMVGRRRIEHVLGDTSGIMETDANESLIEVAQRCDWAVASLPSNVHLPLHRLGVPSIAVSGLRDNPAGEFDLYGFAARGVIFRPVSSVRDLPLSEIIAFYRNGWVERFCRFDASYLREPEEMAAAARAAVLRVLDAKP